MANPTVAGRVRRYDCSQVTDGGAGPVLVSDRWLRANEGRLSSPVARIAGWGHRSASLHLQDKLDAGEGPPATRPDEEQSKNAGDQRTQNRSGCAQRRAVGPRLTPAH
jgi:acetyl-CoA C-acetyltransferase